jgi:leucyl-tRNA synthetase
LLYARFWHKVLYDLGHVTTPEPFYKLVNQGLILGELEFTVFEDEAGQPVGASDLKDIDEEATPEGLRMVGIHKITGAKLYGRAVSNADVEKVGDGFGLKSNHAIRVDSRSFKMSKSRGNVVNPDHILAEYGADAFRLYEMFMGPLEMVKPWNTQGVEGVYRFLGRVWRLFVEEASETEFEQNCAAHPERQPEFLAEVRLHPGVRESEATPAQLKALHTCIRKVTEDLDGMRFNTAISAMMVFVNEALAWETRPAPVLRPFLQLLAPFAPHVAEELWEKLQRAFPGQHADLTYAPWPVFEAAHLVEDTLEIPVQVNGKLRDVIRVPATASSDQIESVARTSEKVQSFLAGKTVRKVIVVPRKLVNLVAN